MMEERMNSILGDCVELAKQMVSIPSVSGSESRLAAFLQNQLATCRGCDCSIDGWASLIALFPGKNKRLLLFDGHIDTVDADASLWSSDPFTGSVRDGKLYGRGSSDMKGALAAMISAAALLVDEKGELPGSGIVVCGTAGEELFEGFTLGKIVTALHSAGYSVEGVIIGEASKRRLMYGQRGRVEIELTTIGKSAHSSSPEAGVNAVDAMVGLLSSLDEMDVPVDPVLGPGIGVVTDILSSPYPGASVLPAQCRVTIDRRTLPGETGSSVLSRYREHIAAFERNEPKYKVEVRIAKGSYLGSDGKKEEIEKAPPAWLLSEDDPFRRTISAVLSKAGVLEGEGTYRFCTNGSWSCGVAGIPTLGFGPGREECAHINDEYLEIEELCKAVKGYDAIMRWWSGVS